MNGKISRDCRFIIAWFRSYIFRIIHKGNPKRQLIADADKRLYIEVIG